MVGAFALEAHQNRGSSAVRVAKETESSERDREGKKMREELDRVQGRLLAMFGRVLRVNRASTSPSWSGRIAGLQYEN
jgi:hypothetical protein